MSRANQMQMKNTTSVKRGKTYSRNILNILTICPQVEDREDTTPILRFVSRFVFQSSIYLQF